MRSSLPCPIFSPSAFEGCWLAITPCTIWDIWLAAFLLEAPGGGVCVLVCVCGEKGVKLFWKMCTGGALIYFHVMNDPRLTSRVITCCKTAQNCSCFHDSAKKKKINKSTSGAYFIGLVYKLLTCWTVVRWDVSAYSYPARPLVGGTLCDVIARTF